MLAATARFSQQPVPGFDRVTLSLVFPASHLPWSSWPISLYVVASLPWSCLIAQFLPYARDLPGQALQQKVRHLVRVVSSMPDRDDASPFGGATLKKSAVQHLTSSCFNVPKCGVCWSLTLTFSIPEHLVDSPRSARPGLLTVSLVISKPSGHWAACCTS